MGTYQNRKRTVEELEDILINKVYFPNGRPTDIKTLVRNLGTIGDAFYDEVEDLFPCQRKTDFERRGDQYFTERDELKAQYPELFPKKERKELSDEQMWI